jgi:hypothetical protein
MFVATTIDRNLHIEPKRGPELLTSESNAQVHHVAGLLRRYCAGRMVAADEAEVVALATRLALDSYLRTRLSIAATAVGTTPIQMATSMLADILWRDEAGMSNLCCSLSDALEQDDFRLVVAFQGTIVNAVAQALFRAWSATDPDGSRLYHNFRRVIRTEPRFEVIPRDVPHWICLKSAVSVRSHGRPWTLQELLALILQCESTCPHLSDRIVSVLTVVGQSADREWAVDIDLLFKALLETARHWLSDQLQQVGAGARMLDPEHHTATREAAEKTRHHMCLILKNWHGRGKIEEPTRLRFSAAVEMVIQDLEQSYEIGRPHFEYLRSVGIEITAADYRASHWRMFDELPPEARDYFFGLLR